MQSIEERVSHVKSGGYKGANELLCSIYFIYLVYLVVYLFYIFSLGVTNYILYSHCMFASCESLRNL
jgi:hypothetical protein